MLQRIDVAPHSLESYAPVVGDATLETLRKAAEPLQGFRIAHINATAYGGGVSELLHSLVPLDRALGIDCEWLVIPGHAPLLRSDEADAQRAPRRGRPPERAGARGLPRAQPCGRGAARAPRRAGALGAAGRARRPLGSSPLAGSAESPMRTAALWPRLFGAESGACPTE